MTTRFRDLGAPFPLFEAPVEEASEYIGAGTCGTCAREAAVRFRLDDDEDAPAGSNACYACLRAGRAALTKDTELGMISSEEALAGVTLGVPGLDHPDFELVPQPDSDWIGARLPQAMMFELLRTPTYITIQGENWLFCCRQPMVYIGPWSRQDFVDHASDGDGETFFEAVVLDAGEDLWDLLDGGDTGVYVFRCASCARFKAHFDFD